MVRKQAIKKAQSTAMDYLVSYIGEKAVAGTPHYEEDKKIWSVSVLFHTTSGLFLAGRIELNEHFEIIFAPSKSEFTKVVEAQLKRLPSIVYADKEALEAKGFEVASLD